jgi:diguanylate cyclase (GGDEF)-like protein
MSGEGQKMKLNAGLTAERFFLAVRRFIPRHLHNNSLLLRQAESVVVAFIATVALMPAFGVLYLLLGDRSSAMLCFGVALGASITPVALRLPRGIVVMREVLISCSFLLLLALTYRLGGITAPTVIWLSVCPIIGMLTGNLGVMFRWVILTGIGILAIYSAQAAGVLFPAVAVTNMPLLHLISILSLGLTVAVYLYLFDKSYSALFRQLNETTKMVQALAIKDELTGIYNRREVLRLAEQERERAERSGKPFSVCLIDIDRFKKINDNFGHGTGDAVLKALTCIIKGQMRTTDIFGRYGGEEFLLIMASTTIAPAHTMIERIQKSIRSTSFSEPGLERVTMSVGIAEHAMGETVAEIISRADKALYEAKNRGRDRVVIAPAPG